MSNHVTPRFGSDKLVSYPHLLASDIPIWERFLDLHSKDFTGFDYDVRVGVGIDPGPDVPSNIHKMALDLTMKRIDVIGYQPGKRWIIEVKQRPGVGAVGQIVSYVILYKLKFPTSDQIIPTIVADIVEPDIRTVLAAQNVTWFEV